MNCARIEAFVNACTGGNYITGPHSCIIDQAEVEIEFLRNCFDSIPDQVTIRPINISTRRYPSGIYAINESSDEISSNKLCHEDLYNIVSVLESLDEPILVTDRADDVLVTIEEDDSEQSVNQLITEYLDGFKDQLNVVGGSNPDEIIVSLKDVNQ